MAVINAIFLAAIGAAAIPILLHFVRRMQAKRVQFSSLMFLSDTPKQLVKKRRLRDILLMTIRASLVALLALAFARPYIPPELVPFVSREANESVVFLIDTSFSMSAGDAFAEAKSEAMERINAADASDEIAIVTFSDAPHQVTELSVEKQLHRSAVASLNAPGFRTTSFYEALRHADEILASARHEQRKIVLLSDLQQNGWPGSLENWKLPSGVLFDPVQVGVLSDQATNSFVDELAITMRQASTPEPGVALRIDARVKNEATNDSEAGNTRVDNRAVLEIDKAGSDARTVPAIENARVSFQQRINDVGLFSGSLKLNDDILSIDNEYFFSFSVDRRPSVLSIDGGSRSSYRESFFLEKAFDLGPDRLFDFETGNAGRLVRRSLEQHEIVFAANLSNISSNALAAIRGYAEEGGVVVLSFGDRANVSAYRTALAELGVGQVDRVVSPESLQGTEAIIGDVSWRHPVFSDLQGAAGGILRPKFRRYVRITADSSATELASFDTGDPWIVERRIGQGSVLVTTATLGSEWTNLPINELYVPFVYQLAKYAVGISQERMLYTVGEPVSFSGRTGSEWDIRDPDGRIFKVALQSSATTPGLARGFFRETDKPGHYVATNGDQRILFSVNVDPKESDLRKRDVEQAYASVVSPSDELIAAELSTADILAAEEKDQKFWRLLLVLVLALFLVETFLANRPGRMKRGRATPALTSDPANHRNVNR